MYHIFVACTLFAHVHFTACDTVKLHASCKLQYIYFHFIQKWHVMFYVSNVNTLQLFQSKRREQEKGVWLSKCLCLELNAKIWLKIIQIFYTLENIWIFINCQ